MWQYAAVLGAVCGLGVFLAVREFIPGRPGLGAALSRLTGQDRPRELDPVEADLLTFTQKAGIWAARRLPAPVLDQAGPSTADLDLIGKTRTHHYGEKALCAVVGLVSVPVLTMGAALLGFSLPISVPAGAGIVLAVLAWFGPDLDAKTKAKAARLTFSRAVSAYLELLAIERISGAGAAQSAFAAAEVAHSWPFQRISTALERGRLNGAAPWTSLRELSAETGVRELGDVADIMEQAGRQGAAVHDQLQSRAATMRDAQLDAEQQIAHDASVRMTIPGTLTVFVYFAMLIFPMVMTMFTTASP